MEAVPGVWEVAEHLKRPAADGVALGGEALLVKPHELGKVGDDHRAVKLVFILAALHKLVLDGVRLIPDIADDLLKHILHRHDAEGAAVFIGDYGEVLLCLAQLIEHRGQLHGLVDIAGLHQKLADIGVAVIRHGLEEVVEIQHTDDVIYAALIDRDARIRGLLDDGHDIVPVVLNVYRADVDTRGHDIERGYLGEVYRGLHKLGLILVQNILVLGSLDDGLELLDGLVAAFVLLVGQTLCDKLDELHDYPDKGFEDDHHKAHGIGVAQSDAVGVLLRGDLRYRLAEDDDKERQHDGRYPRIVLRACNEYHEHGRERGGTDVRKVVADEYGAESIVKMLGYPDCKPGLLGAVIPRVFKAQHVAGGIRHFGRGAEV